jgi:hypothetical protein
MMWVAFGVPSPLGLSFFFRQAGELEVIDTLDLVRVAGGVEDDVGDERPKQQVCQPVQQPLLHLLWIEQVPLARAWVLLVAGLEEDDLREEGG